MEKAKLEKHVVAITDNQAGMFAQVASALTEAKVNLKAICAWSMQDKANFALLTNNNAKAMQVLKAKGYKVEEQEVVTLILQDKVGSAAEIAKKIQAKGINLDCVYGTTCGCPNATALLVLVSKENAKLLSALNG